MGDLFIRSTVCAAAKLGLKSRQLLTLRLPLKGFGIQAAALFGDPCERVNKEINLLIYRSERACQDTS